MDWLIFAGFFLFGAFALLIDARRKYQDSLDQRPFYRHPILESAKIDDLCTKRDAAVGFIFYSLLYLGSYIIILSSAQLYEFVRNANIVKLEVGATAMLDGFESGAIDLLATDYAKPIYVSAFIIAIMSIKALQPIENAVRSASHRLAGIPRGIYRVLDSLNSTKVTEITRRLSYAPMYERFTEICPGEGVDRSHYVEDIRDALRLIDLLSATVSPSRRPIYFPASQLEKLTEMSEQLDGQLNELRDKLKTLQKPVDRGDLLDLHALALTAANNTKALFAVHYIRNNRTLKNIQSDMSIQRVVKVIDRSYNPEQNSFGLGVFFGTCIAIGVTFALYHGWQSALAHQYPSVAEVQISQEISNRAGGLEAPPNASDCLANLYDGNIKRASADDAASGQPLYAASDGNPVNAVCADAMSAGVPEFVRSVQVDLLKQSFWDWLQAGLICFVAVGAVIFGREVRMEEESWKTGWGFTRMPFLTLCGMCVMPAIFAGMGALTGDLVELASDVGLFNITQSQLIDRLQDNQLYFWATPIAGFFMAFGTLCILDQHARPDMKMWKTVLLLGGGTSVIITLFWGLLVFLTYNFEGISLDGFPLSYHQRDVVILSVLPVSFILIFAFFIELTERPSREEREEMRELMNEKAGEKPRRLFPRRQTEKMPEAAE